MTTTPIPRGCPQNSISLYRHYDSRHQLLYVGISNNVLRRFRQHARRAPWFLDIVRVTIEDYPDPPAAGAAETAAIHTEHPKWNRQRPGQRDAPEWPPTPWADYHFRAAWREALYPEVVCALCQSRLARWLADQGEQACA